jgi:hypothetical protein
MVVIIKTKQYFNGKINPVNPFRIGQYKDETIDAMPNIDDIQPASDEGLMTGSGFNRRKKKSNNNNNLRKFISLNIK